MRLVIMGRLPSLNDYINACRYNRYAGAKFKKDTETYITVHILNQIRGVRFEKPVFVTFSWFEPNSKRDLDNIASAKKYILDALVSNKVIPNDGWANVYGFKDMFFVDKVNPRIEVEIM